MIYLEGLGSVIESIYLGEEISNKVGNCNIFVNPENVKYLIGKTVIINICEYSEVNLKQLVENKCHIISRVFIDSPDVEIRPYILRICPQVMWNGRVIKEPMTLDNILECGYCEFDTDEFRLYFPKFTGCTDLVPVDEYGNLSVLGWVLQQVGINITTKTPLTDLDLIKTGKIEFD